MPEALISTTGTVLAKIGDHVFRVVLKNGKEVVAHTPVKRRDLAENLHADHIVALEMTTFDFDKARIIELIG